MPHPPKADAYEPVDSVPEGVRWKPRTGPAAADRTVLLSTPGSFYKLVRDRNTGAVQYFKLKGADDKISPVAIDAEPAKRKQVRFRVGCHCWFVENGRWFLVTVLRRPENHIVITSVTGWDTEKQKEWPIGVELEFPFGGQLYQRLRPLKDRYQ